jgi:signal transduction histidine kinase
MMDLLDLAQMENNTFKINKANFALVDVIKDAFKVVQHSAKQKKIKLLVQDLKEEEKIYFEAIFGDRNRF